MNPDEHQNTLDQQEWRAQCEDERRRDYEYHETRDLASFRWALIVAFAVAAVLVAITWILSA